MNSIQNYLKYYFTITLSSFLFLLIFIGSSAQQDKNADYQKIWALQANSIASELKLSPDKSDKLLQLYVSIRTKLSRELKKLKNTEDKNQDKIAAEKIKNGLRSELNSALKDILTPEQVTESFYLLVSFNPRWDSYVSILSEFNLDKNNFDAGVQFINEYISEYEKSRKAAADSGNRFSATTSRELKSLLDNRIIKLLNAEQSGKWNELTLIGKSKK